MAGVLVSPGFDDAVRRRRSGYKKKGGSPSFKEILRQRCKDRIKATRCALLSQFRNLDSADNVKEMISTMVLEEAKVLSSGQEAILSQSDDMELDFQPLDTLELKTFEDWLLQEYDKVLEEQIKDEVDLLEQAICPLCISSPLINENSAYSSCKGCRVKLPPLDKLTPLLDVAYGRHSDTDCSALPSCSIIEKSLYLFCYDCSNIIHITELTN